jgi:hypothetical protein
MSATLPERLRSEIEAGAILRRAQTNGDFATILQKGDSDRGALILAVTSRGRHVTCLERVASLSGERRWERVGPAEGASSIEVADFLAKRARFDADCWQIELDIASPERFIAETTASG